MFNRCFRGNDVLYMQPKYTVSIRPGFWSEDWLRAVMWQIVLDAETKTQSLNETFLLAKEVAQWDIFA